ncbi:MAG: DUF192 domain-containing protein [Rhodothermaceae bacterium]|nr:DUF192 domain-containing protein [Rhodothermaceae bacterium]
MRRFLQLLPVLLILAACADDPTPPSASNNGECEETPGITYRTDAQLTFLRPDSTVIKEIGIEIVARASTIQRGLMQRQCLPDDWGMLFVFPNAAPRTFYMANTPRSLDIMFFSADSTLLNVAKYAEPFDPNVLPSDGPARFVVETPAGFADRFGLGAGDRIMWTAPSAN